MDKESALLDILWKNCQEHWQQGRHHELQRSSVANVLIAISGAVIGLVTFDKSIDISDAPLTIFLIVIAVFGVVFSAKHYERFSFHIRRAKGYREKINNFFPDANLSEIRVIADEKHSEKHPKLKKIHLHYLWFGLYVLIALMGGILTIIAVGLISIIP
jgi:uncharacterized protein YacL